VEGFEVSRRTIERDLHALSARFPLLVDDRSRPYGWSWSRSSGLIALPRLSPSQSVALLLARAHLRKLFPEVLAKEIAPIFDAAEQALSHSGWKDWHARTAVIPQGLALMQPRIPTGTLAAVQSALSHRRCLSARYRTKGSKEAKEFLIHPLGLISRGVVLYLACTIFDYDDVLQLALHRLSCVKETGFPAREPQGFDFQIYARAAGSKYRGKGRTMLVARFDPDAAEHLRETPLAEDQAMFDLDDGRIEVRATVEDDETLRWWLLGFGSMVEVIRPLRLREIMREEVVSLTRMYSNQGQP
jgi:predicted DNA-binding transcriptional regulator YafY